MILGTGRGRQFPALGWEGHLGKERFLGRRAQGSSARRAEERGVLLLLELTRALHEPSRPSSPPPDSATKDAGGGGNRSGGGSGDAGGMPGARQG